MAIYGNLITNESNRLDFGSFLDFIEESDNQMINLFNNFNILKEDNDLSVIKNNESNNSTESDSAEKVKQTIIERVKSIISKFVKAVKDLFIAVKDAIIKKYEETNLKDKFMSKYSKIVTYDNMQKAIDKGWEGFNKNTLFVRRLARLSDTKFSRIIENYKLSDKIEEIYKAKDLQEAQTKYKEVNTDIEKFSKEHDNIMSMEFRASTDAIVNRNNDVWFVRMTNINKFGKIYPAPGLFDVMKKLAETGEREIKLIPKTADALLKDIQLEKEISTNGIKSYKKGGSNYYEDNKDENRISIMYYKSKYNYASSFIKVASSMVKQVASAIQYQYNSSITNYLTLIRVIKRYVPNVA